MLIFIAVKERRYEYDMIARINAAARANGVTYSQLVNSMDVQE
jgi:ribosomal protein L20